MQLIGFALSSSYWHQVHCRCFWILNHLWIDRSFELIMALWVYLPFGKAHAYDLSQFWCCSNVLSQNINQVSYVSFSCNIGLVDNGTSLKLSHKITTFLFVWIRSSLRNDSNHITFAVALARLGYSNSMLDLDTVGCFFEHHDIGFSPR